MADVFLISFLGFLAGYLATYAQACDEELVQRSFVLIGLICAIICTIIFIAGGVSVPSAMDVAALGVLVMIGPLFKQHRMQISHLQNQTVSLVLGLGLGALASADLIAGLCAVICLAGVYGVGIGRYFDRKIALQTVIFLGLGAGIGFAIFDIEYQGGNIGMSLDISSLLIALGWWLLAIVFAYIQLRRSASSGKLGIVQFAFSLSLLLWIWASEIAFMNWTMLTLLLATFCVVKTGLDRRDRGVTVTALATWLAVVPLSGLVGPYLLDTAALVSVVALAAALIYKGHKIPRVTDAICAIGLLLIGLVATFV